MKLKHIKNLTEDQAEIILFDEIGVGNAVGSEVAAEVAWLVDHKKVKEIIVRINSAGGSMIEGFGIFSALMNARDQGVNIVVSIEGLAASMAGAIAMVGNEIKMVDFGMLMIHDPNNNGKSASNEAEQAILDKFKDSAIIMMVNRTGKSKNEISDIMAAETWMNAEEALAAGFITEIVSSQISAKTKATAHLELKEICMSMITVYPTNGTSLAAVLNRSINSKDDREATISSMASSAGISVSTVKQILSASITCPPLDRIESFAKTLGVSLKSLTDAGTTDGCNYNTENNMKMKKITAHFKLEENASEDTVLAKIKENADSKAAVEATNKTLTDDAAKHKTEIEDRDKEITDLKAKMTASNGTTIKALLDSAVTAGRIKKDSVESLVKNFTDVASVTAFLDSIQDPKINVMDLIDLSKINDNKDVDPEMGLREMERKDPARLERIRANEPELYGKMYKLQYGKELPA